MDQLEAIAYWKQSAAENAQAARDTMEKHPEWAFFLWHLSIEKALKGLVTKTGQTPPPIHILLKLAEIASLSLNPEQQSVLKEITSYAISARYDDYKKSYYKKVTQVTYKQEWSNKCEEVYLWLHNLI